MQGTTPQGLPEKQPTGDEKTERQQDGAGPSGQGGQAEWVARGGSGRGSKHHGVDPVVPFTDLAQLQAVREFYGLGEDVNLERHLVTRSTMDVDKPKRLYYVGPGALPWHSMQYEDRLLHNQYCPMPHTTRLNSTALDGA